jgi:hypothetical protein
MLYIARTPNRLGCQLKLPDTTVLIYHVHLSDAKHFDVTYKNVQHDG